MQQEKKEEEAKRQNILRQIKKLTEGNKKLVQENKNLTQEKTKLLLSRKKEHNKTATQEKISNLEKKISTVVVTLDKERKKWQQEKDLHQEETKHQSNVIE